MIRTSNSWWGIKESGDDITSPMMNIINNANVFILLGGYNFTFRSSATSRPFFDALSAKLLAGVPVLMMFPPRLHGRFNPQPAIIQHCLNNGIGVVLNHQNHSKWLLTESQLYYGSSNFTNASWRDRVEVISLHDHTNIPNWWSTQTISDFRDFINKEVSDLTHPRRKMKTFRGLLTATRTTWRSIKPLISKLNPSIKKVISTIESYDEVQLMLEKEIVYWFDHYDKTNFQLVFELSSDIMRAIDDLCEFAYGSIYNESVDIDYNDVDEQKIASYNSLYKNAIAVIDISISKLSQNEEDNIIQSNYSAENVQRIESIQKLMNEHLKQ